MCKCLDRGDRTAHVDECCYDEWVDFRDRQERTSRFDPLLIAELLIVIIWAAALTWWLVS